MTALMPIAALIVGLLLLIWSADRFVEGASATARHFAVPPLLVGMVIVGFGTSAPELVVSALAASQGNPSLALGNAWGSNIVNMGLILGVTALIAPIQVRSQVLRKELPLLIGVTALSALLAWDLGLSRWDAIVLLAAFALLMGWSIREAMTHGDDALAHETDAELHAHAMPLPRALLWLVLGLLVLVGACSSSSPHLFVLDHVQRQLLGRDLDEHELARLGVGAAHLGHGALDGEAHHGVVGR